MNFFGFSRPVKDRYSEDYLPGSIHEFGDITVEEKDIISFGRLFDSPVFHTDPQAAKTSIYGGLITSGWHTASLMMREFVRFYLSRTASLGSPEVDELRWNLRCDPATGLR